MGSFLADCPHCGAGKSAFISFGARMTWNRGGKAQLAVAAYCPHCNMPIMAMLDARIRPAMTASDALDHARVLLNSTEGPGAGSYAVVDRVWPTQPPPRIPDHLPEKVARPLRQAEHNFQTNGTQDAAAAMYRKALEQALKAAFPAVTGSLKNSIGSLVARHIVPAAMGDWAHEIRIIGNEAVHDGDAIERDHLVAMRDFVDSFLRYVFTLPREVEIRRGIAEEAPSLDPGTQD